MDELNLNRIVDIILLDDRSESSYEELYNRMIHYVKEYEKRNS